jgi:hypothetical protein
MDTGWDSGYAGRELLLKRRAMAVGKDCYIMIKQSRIAAPWSFWVIGIVTLLWNALGSMNFMMQMKAENVAAMPEPFHTIVVNRPSWATAAFALAVVAGTIGCLLLLLRRRESIYLFIASLVGTAVHLIPYLSPSNLPAQFGIGNVTLVFIMPMLVAGFLVWYANYAQRKTWTGR